MNRALRSLALIYYSALALGCNDSTAPDEAADRPILFIGRRREGDEEARKLAIYAVSRDGSGLRRLTSGSDETSYPAWSRDRKQIAFSKLATIWLMQPDGSNPRPAVSNPPTCGYTNLSWDPTGTRIAAECFWDVAVLDLTTGELKGISPGLEDTMIHPSWSPDGKLIAFGDPFAPNVYTRDANGGPRAQLFENGSEPTWSPSGSRIAFKGAGAAEAGIYIANADGSARERLTRPVYPAEDEGPTWSSDGQWIAFHRRGRICRTPDQTSGDGCFDGWGVFVMRSDGSQLRRVSPDSLDSTRPSW